MRVVVSTGKRKTSLAKATIKDGKGRIRINGKPLEILQPEVARLRIMEPLLLFGDGWKKYDIRVRVRGGGFMSQADAVRMAIATGLIKMSQDYEARSRMLEHDRTMLVGDPRRTEPKKFGGPSARSRYQKSYR
ncbi:MAG TPA: 30S ribosomal protein S9 [Candidatus Thorarchaeota archaeon]|nr:MAG: 30S ribosomal protein S9 [Candidatus Thorarchaeota archaeon]RLI62283.1 MAG: 30S ribosomal protein S9 [Candidatus Thorarchaeota archaeon]HDD67629.1 30S ribosomal protein S9 [Candidatus Thorarchaeota archaeon]